jgi:hypothetical protein
MNKPWSDLPNARYIDWVLDTLNENIILWTEAETVAGVKTNEPLAEAWIAARTAKRYETAWVPVMARHVTFGGGQVLAALVAYDDCDQYIALGYENLRVYAILSEKPQALLLLPMSYVREKLNEQALV